MILSHSKLHHCNLSIHLPHEPGSSGDKNSLVIIKLTNLAFVDVCAVLINHFGFSEIGNYCFVCMLIVLAMRTKACLLLTVALKHNHHNRYNTI